MASMQLLYGDVITDALRDPSRIEAPFGIGQRLRMARQATNLALPWRWTRPRSWSARATMRTWALARAPLTFTPWLVPTGRFNKSSRRSTPTRTLAMRSARPSPSAEIQRWWARTSTTRAGTSLARPSCSCVPAAPGLSSKS